MSAQTRRQFIAFGLTALLAFAAFAALISGAQPAFAQSPGDSEGEIESGGETRTYRLHIPPTYDPDGPPVALVVNLHGFTSTAAQQERYSRMSAKADEAGFVVVHPQGLGTPSRWNMAPETGERTGRENPDLVFIRDLVAHLQEELNIDPARVYATGLSNGGGMANRLGCDLSELFAAIAPVAGAYPLADDCDPERPVPVMAFHGADDPIVPYEGIERVSFLPGATLPPIPEWAAGWAARNDCDETPTLTVESYEEGDVTIQMWGGCADSADVTLYTIDGIGHVWPGGPAVLILGDTGPISATDLMWAFFEAHPMPKD